MNEWEKKIPQESKSILVALCKPTSCRSHSNSEAVAVLRTHTISHNSERNLKDICAVQ